MCVVVTIYNIELDNDQLQVLKVDCAGMAIGYRLN